MALPSELKSCPIFYELYEKEIEQVVHHCSVYSVKSGEIFVEEGTEGKELFVILTGSVALEKKRDSSTHRVATLHKGDVFGETVLVDQKHRTASAVALKDSDIIEIPYDEIFNLFKKHPRVFGLIMLNVSRMLSRRLAEKQQ